MVNKETKVEIKIALNEYVLNSSDVYDKIYKINNPNTYVEVVKMMDCTDEEFEEDVKDVWYSMKKEYFAW